MSEPNEPDALKTLGERIEQARRAHEGPRRAVEGGTDPSAGAAMGLGFRIGLELVVAVFVGFGIGWAIDHWLGTKPWGLLVFLFLGIGAGLTNVYRVVKGMGMGVGYKAPGPRDEKSGWDED
ncbi:MAG TPA: AtpZ/AtpI family protein [Stellaceae bacterium]|nr:AtpZ/AtpI family protein [Stellaceae bacterium]